MAELGERGREAHDDLGRLAVRLDISQVLAVGDNAKPIAHGAALEGSWDGESVWVRDCDEAIQLIRHNVRPTDVILIKASRSEGLERIAMALQHTGETLRHAGERPRHAGEAQ
jgi:UDP-N-acetylmuramoyl-tripeptide--D-alanyl-D-alanine ligase